MITPLEAQLMQERCDKGKKRVASEHLEQGPPPDSIERESDLQSAIVEDARERGWLVFWGSMAHKSRRTPGEPDLTILASIKRETTMSIRYEPTVFFIECKRKNGKRSPAQMQIEAHARKLGHTIHLVKALSEWLTLAGGNEP
jgi:hypothetical protein